MAQDAYLRAWQRWDQVSRCDDPVAWVARVAWTLATSRLRRLTVAARFARRRGDRSGAVEQALGPDRVALVAALRQIPERQRLAIVLHYLADWTVADIAAELGVARGTVLSWLYRGRARLAVLLGDADGGSDDA